MVAAATVGAAVVGAAATTYAADQAADAQSEASDKALNAQASQLSQQRSDTAPWREAGTRALPKMEGLADSPYFTMADYQADPGYQFRMDEGMKALQRSASAKGNLLSGGTLKGLTRYAQGEASNEYQNAYNRFNTNRLNRFNQLSGLAGTGQVANQQLVSAGQNYANNASNLMTGMGNANAAGAIAQGNAITGTLGGLANNWTQYQAQQQMQPQMQQSGGYGFGGQAGNYGAGSMGYGIGGSGIGSSDLSSYYG